MPIEERFRGRAIVSGLALVFVIVLGATGGSSRDDVFISLFTQIAAVALLGALLLPATRAEIRFAGPPLAFLLAVAGLMIAQLVPLPPAIWMNLPGRELYATAAEVIGMPQPWRPVSLSPDRTADSLLGLLPVFATLLTISLSPPRFSHAAISALLGLAVASSVLAAFQVSSGTGSLRFYSITSADSGVGLLANRNHQAALLAMAIPAAAWWATRPATKRISAPVRLGLGVSMLLLFLVAALLTQSRTGLLLCGVAVLGAVALAWPRLRHIPAIITYVLAGTVVAAGILLLVFLLPRHRALAQSAFSDPRFTFWPRTLEMIGEFFPIGAGMGTFDRVYPRFERLADLVPEYTNRAHNDFLEIGAEAGLFGYALLALFLAWLVLATIRVWRTPPSAVHDVTLARLCSLVVVIGLMASVTDYPLRTPLLGCIFAGSCVALYRVARHVAAVRFSGTKAV